jgi:hypothetical protein
MKSSLMKLNHASTFSGKGQVLTFSNYACVGILVKLGGMLWLGMARTNDQMKRRSGYR